ncbi:MAG TPA: AAA family ATPase [Streptosporangiaceae bacterium]|nr:AAA family ATPase [Streptosporangiaceae bacterium]
MADPERPVADWSREPWGQVAETHSAVVFFAGDRACKLKKPVSLGFLDFSTPESRMAACAREVELNLRFAPDVYLGVAEIRGPGGQVCDHLVVMRRMPAARRLSALVRSRAPVARPLRQVARILAVQHAQAARGPQIDQQGSSDALHRRWTDNIDETRQIAERLAPRELPGPAVTGEIERLALRFLAGRAPLFDARIRDGRIVDGHGDLIADDIFCLDDGPRILDCLDFDDRLRWLDGLDDAAFLGMDLERLGAPALAEEFMAAYADYSGDPAPASLTRHYVAYRAFVRVKVACLRVAQGDPAAGFEARQLAEVALRHLQAGAVTLVVVGGLPGTGKSALAAAVAGRLGFTVLNSDRIRKELAGLPAQTSARRPYGSGLYTAGWTERTYAELLHRAAVLLARGESVIADASFISAPQRAAAAAAAAGVSADLVQLRCTASRELAARRMSARASGASDADQAVAAEMEAVAEPWPDASVIDTGSGGTARAPSGTAQEAVEMIRPHGPGHLWRPARPYMLPG